MGISLLFRRIIDIMVDMKRGSKEIVIRMKKTKLLALVTGITLLFTGCGAYVDNGGIPTEEQLVAVESELGDEIQSLKFAVNGCVYQLPVTVEELYEDGWYMDKDVASELKTLGAYTRTMNVVFYKNMGDGYGRATMGVVLNNETAKEVPIEEAQVYSVGMSAGSATLVLPGGITWNSTFEEVIDAYQLSEDEYTEKSDYMVIILNVDGHTLFLRFNVSTRTLSSIEFK